MLSKEVQIKIRKKALELFKKANIALTNEEIKRELKIVEFGDKDFFKIGLVFLTFINNSFHGGRFILFFPGQYCPLHIHPEIEGSKGKVETFRVLFGQVIANYFPDDVNLTSISVSALELESASIPKISIILNPGEQYTVKPTVKHWYKAGPDGAIAMEISNPLKDEHDIWPDKTSSPRAY